MFGWARRHRWFLGVLGVGAALRAVAMLGYRPALWFPDSYTYVVTALKPRPDLVRPAGYPMFLRLLEPFHSFALVTLVQHLMGLCVGVLVYLTARRLRAPGWAATLASAPALLDAYQIELEHLLVSDTLFGLLVTAAACLGVRRSPGWRTACGIGLLLAAATLTRTVGLPLVAVFAGWLIVRERGRVFLAGVMLAAAAVPVIGYGAWFYATHQRIGIVGANGVFLYAKTMTFADCAVMRPPPDLATLCDPRPPAKRPPAQEYVWSPDSPLVRRPGITFTRESDELAARFASLAIRSQPLDYLSSVTAELARSFTLGRPVYPDREIYDYYEFPETRPAPPGRYPAMVGAEFARRYEAGPIEPRIVEPYAGWIRAYQSVAGLPGAALLVLLLVPPVVAGAQRLRAGRPARVSPGTGRTGDPGDVEGTGSTEGTERPGSTTAPTTGTAPGPTDNPTNGPVTGPATGTAVGSVNGPAAVPAAWALPWAVAATLLVMPPAVAEFDYRYVLPAVPAACLAAALSVRKPNFGNIPLNVRT
ncbi:hypothetical protein FHS43_000931 [Streptosporangium becharense]|uniref:Glycosyltransferase RgtA/B/C/D-like domain-containing protein n=1 Tax=Streptosporangium becharense TaxID=1816182 RepID=A0A7W9MGE4_9ACTN|nr:hypothetical protein [Streptosporangium becharense]MBB2909685.1 hypothetical protein [Streptosporangium becharense]MBB5819359.1 hypothetical protein [Streptosporangium becharense]